VAYGTIDAFGGVFVNGVRYNVSQAKIHIDDQMVTEGDLHVGDVVRVTGKIPWNGGGLAESVEVKQPLHGPVTSVAASGTSLIVLGQTVLVDADVVFDASVPHRFVAGLVAGDIVEVAGLAGRDGSIVASRIAKKPLGPRGLKVTGTATEVDRDRMRFTINELRVDSRDAWTTLPNEIADGDRVEVLGSSLSADGQLIATQIRRIGPQASINAAGMRTDLEGVIAAHDAASPPTSFMLDGILVTTRPSTRYVGSRPASWLDAKVAVTGVVQPDNSIVAKVVRFSDPAPVQLRARVDSVTPAEDSFVMLGITIETPPFARITDESAIHANPFNLSNLAPGEFVHVAGVAAENNRLVTAALVERIDAEDWVQLQSYAQAPSYEKLVMLGVNITTTPSTRYPMPTGGNLGAGTFFFDLNFDSLIEVRGEEVADREILAHAVRSFDWAW
jgi:hypothetical protein